jgi:hypothetical protein
MQTILKTLFAWGLGLSLAQAQPLEASTIERLTGAKPTLNSAEKVLKVSWPRTDLKVTVDGTVLPPFMGLTSWAAFQPGGRSQAMVMGDLVLFEDEVNPVMDMVFSQGLAVTALHNHFFFEHPRVYFMHIGGEGTTEQLAGGVRQVMDKIHEIRKERPEPVTGFGLARPTLPSDLKAAAPSEVLGEKFTEKDGMVKFVFGRTVKMPCECTVGSEMGVNTWAAFMGSSEQALVDGDFVTLEGELQPVLRKLRARGIQIVAIHSHMEGESPHAIFLHYWGAGKALDLARAVKAAVP